MDWFDIENRTVGTCRWFNAEVIKDGDGYQVIIKHPISDHWKEKVFASISDAKSYIENIERLYFKATGETHETLRP